MADNQSTSWLSISGNLEGLNWAGSTLGDSEANTREGIPMFRNLELFLGWNVHPLLFVLQDFADRAPLYAVFDRNIFLSSRGVLLMIQADLLTVDVKKTLLFVFSDHGGIDLALALGLTGGRGNGCEGDRKSTRLNSSHVLRSRMPSSA